MGKMTVATVGSFYVFIKKWLEYCILHGNQTFSGKVTFSNFLLIDLILLEAEWAFPQGLLFLQKTRPQDFGARPGADICYPCSSVQPGIYRPIPCSSVQPGADIPS